jgi:hypothetical protein
MSFAALAIISKMKLGSAAEKLIALAYADRHNEETGCAYPSIAALCEFSSLNRKTVVAAVGRLEAAGLLSDTGDRRGETKQIKVYRLNIDSAENGTVPKSEPSQIRNSTGKRPKQSQKRDTEPVRTNPSPDASHPPKGARSGASQIKPHRMPADWKHERFADGTVAREIADRRGKEWSRAALESFRNWAANADDRVGRKRDWQRAWANWVIEQDNRDGRRPGNQRVGGNDGQPRSGHGRTVDAALAFVADG